MHGLLFSGVQGDYQLCSRQDMKLTSHLYQVPSFGMLECKDGGLKVGKVSYCCVMDTETSKHIRLHHVTTHETSTRVPEVVLSDKFSCGEPNDKDYYRIILPTNAPFITILI